MNDLELVQEAIEAALAAGATSADACLVCDAGTHVHVRDGAVEKVSHSNARGIGVRAFRGTQRGMSYTNDTSSDAARSAGRQAAELAEVAAEDPAAGLPEPGGDVPELPDLDPVDADHGRYDTDFFREKAAAAERAATADERIDRSAGARAGGGWRRVALANSQGFSGVREGTGYGLMAGVFATGEHGERQRDAWSDSACHLSDLASPESVGAEAARRAIRRGGWRKPESGPVPVVLPPDVAADFVRQLTGALLASSVYRGGSFLGDELGNQVASEAFTLVDDATLPRRPASRTFDGEGVPSRRTVLFDRGRLASWLADSYSARRTGTHSTGNAARGLASPLGVSPSNLVLEPGTRTPADLLGSVSRGIYVTDLIGFGVNLTTGTYSRGAGGVWIENGKLTYPVQEFTVAGDLRDLLRGIAAVGNDLTWRGATAAPTVLLEGLTVAAG